VFKAIRQICLVKTILAMADWLRAYKKYKLFTPESADLHVSLASLSSSGKDEPRTGTVELITSLRHDNVTVQGVQTVEH